MQNYEYLLKDIMSPDYYQYLDLREIPKGEYLLLQGQQLTQVYILLKGKVRTTHITSNGSTHLYSISSPLTLIGEVEFMSRQDVQNDVFAMTDCECYVIDVIRYRDVFMKDLVFMTYICTTIANRIHVATQNFSISVNFPVENRLASYMLAVEQGDIVEENFVEVAQMIGCSYRQLQRVIKHFISLGYIEKVKRSVYHILDRSALEELGEDLYFT